MSFSLMEQPVLVLDCQATGAYASGGHLLEVGWASMTASLGLSEPQHCFLVRMPAGATIPLQVQRVTGLKPSDLSQGHSCLQIWRQLREAFTAVARQAGRQICPTVVHFSRFEGPFLRDLQCLGSTRAAKHFQLICTHEIARRLLSELPRRTLRALAGFFGCSIPKMRRCNHHLQATAAVWSGLVQLLQQEQGVSTLEELDSWLSKTPPSSGCGRAYPMQRETRLGVSEGPGVYRLHRLDGGVLYVGKSTSLKRRVNSYFQKRHPRAERTLEMLTQARELTFTETKTALEAALLEADEIKRLDPAYNQALTESDRKLCYYSRRTEKLTSRPQDNRSLGPLPGQASGKLLSLLRMLESRQKQETDVADLRGTFSLGVSAKSWLEGVDNFFARYAREITAGSSVQALLRVGARARAQKEPSTHGYTDSIGGLFSEPEASRVVVALESISCSLSLLLRRSRWLCYLTEATIAWQQTEEMDRVLLTLAGQIVSCAECHRSEPLVVPEGSARPIFVRQQGFDLAQYDRLRVLSTELKRVAGAGRRLRVRIGPGSSLSGRRLERILKWV